jgi:hypothetical protein
MRAGALVLLLAAAAGADPFAPTREIFAEQGLDDAAYARYAESLALLSAAIAKDPADAAALGRAVALLECVGTATELEETVRRAVATEKDGPRRGPLLSLLGHLVVLRAEESAGGVWVFVNGQLTEAPEIDEETKKLLAGAVEALREAIRLVPKDARAREDLATALQRIDRVSNGAEVARLRMEAVALRPPALARPKLPADARASRLWTEARDLEQKEPPDHAGALLLRKQALVCDFCSGTIPSEYDPALYGPVSLLAPEDFVQRSLTRTYRKRDGTLDGVAPVYHPAPSARRRTIVEGLGRDPGSAAGAALLKLLATARVRDTVVESALAALAAGRHEAVRAHLPGLLAATVLSPETEFGPLGQRLLVEAAVALRLQAAAPVLAVLLPYEEDLLHPRGLAAAVGELGGPAEADLVLGVARDAARDVFFRREAILALGRLAPERIAEVPAEPPLELALAAARYRAAPSEALRGRLLQGLGHPHEVDDAARYLADLGVREAIPDIERLLAEKPDHYAAAALRAARSRLVGG